ncbi:MAG: hypothetical protein HY879_26935 [Deltaproteobacteria bacterium]|nr:hypothetical protein [Deltaproteobacteria bacterium]
MIHHPTGDPDPQLLKDILPKDREEGRIVVTHDQPQPLSKGTVFSVTEGKIRIRTLPIV